MAEETKAERGRRLKRELRERIRKGEVKQEEKSKKIDRQKMLDEYAKDRKYVKNIYGDWVLKPGYKVKKMEEPQHIKGKEAVRKKLEAEEKRFNERQKKKKSTQK